MDVYHSVRFRLVDDKKYRKLNLSKPESDSGSSLTRAPWWFTGWQEGGKQRDDNCSYASDCLLTQRVYQTRVDAVKVA